MSTQTQDSAALVAALSAAVAARKDSLVALRERITSLLDAIPIGVTLSEDDVQLQVARICTGASQWSNRTWDVTIRGIGYLCGGKLLAAACEQSYWDGHNRHHRSTEPYLLGGGYEDGRDTPLRWLSGKETRRVAGYLPVLIARYVAECEAEREANTETLTA